MFVCGYCGKEFGVLSERCKCEVECGKKQEEEAYRKKQNELLQIKKDRDDEITNAIKTLVSQIGTFHSDYNERCSAECSSTYKSAFDQIRSLSIIQDLLDL